MAGPAGLAASGVDRFLKMNEENPAVDALIVSVGRSASTAVYQYLNRACELNLPSNKEPHHWMGVSRYQGRYALLDSVYVPERGKYIELYRESMKVVDASVGYFFYIDDVIHNLRAAGQRPKVVFLYRDPLSRAISLFNELKKKGLTSNETVLEDLGEVKPAGLWWENYYDNVMYYDNFKRMSDYFEDILAVSYDAFRLDPAAVFGCIAHHLDMPIVRSIDYVAVNSSAEAKLQMSAARMRWMTKHIPAGIKSMLRGFLVGAMGNSPTVTDQRIAGYLTRSIEQYKAFREFLGEKDIVCSSR